MSTRVPGRDKLGSARCATHVLPRGSAMLAARMNGTKHASDHDTVGLMKVSIERGLFRRIDVERVSGGVHYTEDACWLLDPVAAFIDRIISEGRARIAVDPFAGDGHMLAAVDERFRFEALTGFDIANGKWRSNDSLLGIDLPPDALVVTNPPYLAKSSAKRKGVLSLVAKYFESGQYDDLYLVALDRILRAGVPAVVIVPETFVSSGLFRDALDRVVVLEKDNPFPSTETPVCVACFDPARTGAGADYFVDARFVGRLEQLEAAARIDAPERDRRRIRFNVPDGGIALKAVDGTAPEDRIRFLRGDAFGYSAAMIKGSSRLMTRVSVRGLDAARVDGFVRDCNALLARIRRRSGDAVLSPFKGNNRAAVRRRRLDYALARSIMAAALGDGPAAA